MDYTVIRYRVKENSVDENRSLIRKVFEELEQVDPKGFRYLVLELEDGEFMHIVGASDQKRCISIAWTGSLQVLYRETRGAPIDTGRAIRRPDYR